MAEKDPSPNLTDLDIIELSKRITTQHKLREIAVRLRVEPFHVQAAVNDNKKITEAAQHVLQEWRQTQSTAEEAYKNLEEALRACGQLQLLESLNRGTGTTLKQQRLSEEGESVPIVFFFKH